MRKRIVQQIPRQAHAPRNHHIAVGCRLRKPRDLHAWYNTPRMGWWKKTDFWIAIILLAISIIGFARGNAAIADPGQDVDPRLAWLYLVAAVIMLINGILSHRQYLREQEAQKAKQPATSQQEATTR